jgi:tetratricopeptide (TPR) repeat protein
MIGAYRTAEVEGRRGHPLKEVLQRARRERRNTEIKLSRLKKEHIGSMISSMLEVKVVPDGFVDLIEKEAEGNPFFIEEVLKSLVQEGVIAGEGADLDKVDIGKVKVPRSVTDLISRKIEKLDDSERKVLEYAAIIGESFSVEVLSKVIDMDEMELVDLLERLMDLKIVTEFTEKADIKYKFSHKQFREVIYNGLSSARKRLHHKKVGHALEELPERQKEGLLFSLAHHLTMAMEIEKAVHYTVRAAERAENGFAAEDAISYYEKALELLERLPPEKVVQFTKKDAVAKIAELKFLTDSWADAMRYLDALEKVAISQNDETTLAEVYMKKGHIERMRGKWTQAAEFYDKALEISEKVHDDLGIAETLQGLGHILALKADYEVAKAYLEKSMEISNALDDTLSQGRTMVELGHVLRDQGDYDNALAAYTDGLMLLEKAGDQFSMTRAYMSIGDLCIRTEEWDKAIDFYSKAQSFAERTKDNQMRGWAMFKLGECYGHKNNFEKAEDLCGKAVFNILRTDDRVGQAYAYSSYGVVFRLKGDYGKAFVQFQQALNLANDLDMPAVTANINLEIGLMCADKGDVKGANRHFEKSRKLYDKVDAKALAEQASRLLMGDDRFGKPKDMQHYLDKSMKAMQRRTERRDKRAEKVKHKERSKNKK